jgi:hypothetical protein
VAEQMHTICPEREVGSGSMTDFEDGFAKAIELMRKKMYGSTSSHIEKGLIMTWLKNLEQGKWKDYDKKKK